MTDLLLRDTRDGKFGSIQRALTSRANTAGLQYSRWGLIEGSSVEGVTKRLKDFQSFEQAYLKFFGSSSWGRSTFFNPVGPIVVMDQIPEDQSAVLEKRYQLDWLQDRINKVSVAVQPSLENNERQGPGSPVKAYFDQIRDSLQRVSKVYSQLFHPNPQVRFIESGIAQAKTQITQAEDSVAKITSILPTVKLPASKAWMSHAERAGSDGTIQVEVTETGSGVTVQQTWSGGDGSMTGTVIVTAIAYADIGKVDLRSPTRHGDDRWTVCVESATRSFPQTLDSPQRKTATAAFRAVHTASTEKWLYFAFSNSAEAQDAYAYFLYHKQLGR
jgi:hypothetical protein